MVARETPPWLTGTTSLSAWVALYASAVPRPPPEPVHSSDLSDLLQGPLFWFRDWPNRAVPTVAAGVYTIWRGEEFIYVGMSGRGRTSDDLEKRRSAGASAHGLYTRLASHASGRRSGDQFCVYVADRLVLPTLTADDIRLIGAGTHSMDAFVRRFIHAELSYRFLSTRDGARAFEVEKRARGGALGALPLLNPFRSRTKVRVEPRTRT